MQLSFPREGGSALWGGKLILGDSPSKPSGGQPHYPFQGHLDLPVRRKKPARHGHGGLPNPGGDPRSMRDRAWDYAVAGSLSRDRWWNPRPGRAGRRACASRTGGHEGRPRRPHGDQHSGGRVECGKSRGAKGAPPGKPPGGGRGTWLHGLFHNGKTPCQAGV